MSIRILKKEDFNEKYLALLEQLTQVDKNKILKNDFEKYVDSQNDEWRTFIYEIKTDNDIYIPSGSITVFIEKKIIHGLGKVGHIEDVVCDKNIRGKGIGKKLIDFATNYCYKHGCYKVILDCADHNIGFYEKCGYQHKGSEMAIYF